MWCSTPLCCGYASCFHGLFKARNAFLSQAVPGVLLSPIQGMVSVWLAAAIQYVKAASIMVAFFAAVAILLEGSVSGNAPSDGTVPE